MEIKPSGNSGEFKKIDMSTWKKQKLGDIALRLSAKYTIQFIGAWEQLHNQNFNVMEFNNIKNEE